MNIPSNVANIAIGVVIVLIIGGIIWFATVQNSKAVEAEIDFFQKHKELMEKGEETLERLKGHRGPYDGSEPPPFPEIPPENPTPR